MVPLWFGAIGGSPILLAQLVLFKGIWSLDLGFLSFEATSLFRIRWPHFNSSFKVREWFLAEPGRKHVSCCDFDVEENTLMATYYFWAITTPFKKSKWPPTCLVHTHRARSLCFPLPLRTFARDVSPSGVRHRPN